MTTIETPLIDVEDVIDKIDDIPDMVAHLYRAFDSPPRVSRCGIPSANDPHTQFHRANGFGRSRHTLGATACQKCGAPICEVCLAEHDKERGWR